MGAEKYLIVRLAAIGDVVMASTVIARIRARSPNAGIHWLCGATAAPLVALFEGVDEVIPVDERQLLRGGPLARAAAVLSVWRRLIGSGYTHVVLLHVDPHRCPCSSPPLVARKLNILSRKADARSFESRFRAATWATSTRVSWMAQTPPARFPSAPRSLGCAQSRTSQTNRGDDALRSCRAVPAMSFERAHSSDGRRSDTPTWRARWRKTGTRWCWSAMLETTGCGQRSRAPMSRI